MCVCSLCYIVPGNITIVEAAPDINWDVLTEQNVTWATYKDV